MVNNRRNQFRRQPAENKGVRCAVGRGGFGPAVVAIPAFVVRDGKGRLAILGLPIRPLVTAVRRGVVYRQWRLVKASVVVRRLRFGLLYTYMVLVAIVRKKASDRDRNWSSD